MKFNWTRFFTRGLIFVIIGVFVILQSSTWHLSIAGIKLNFIFGILVFVAIAESLNFSLLLALGVGFCYDLLSSNSMGFYMLAYFLPLCALIFFVNKIRSNLSPALFGLTVFFLSTIKLFIEFILLIMIYAPDTALFYLRGIGFLEVILTTICSFISYIILQVGLRSLRGDLEATS